MTTPIRPKEADEAEEVRPAFVRKPADELFRNELASIMMDLMSGQITTQKARLHLHAWFKALPQEDQVFLYQNDRGKREAQLIGNYGAMFVQEIPALMSQVVL